jgi:hypothetical protein
MMMSDVPHKPWPYACKQTQLSEISCAVAYPHAYPVRTAIYFLGLHYESMTHFCETLQMAVAATYCVNDSLAKICVRGEGVA